MKGYIYTLEVLIAISIILISMVSVFRTAPAKSETELSIIKQSGFDALLYLDQKGILRGMVMEGDEAGLENQLKNIFPKNVQFETDICRTSCYMTNLPENETIIAVDYYIGGYKENYLGERVRLFLWRKF
jgi:hypothetical protein